MTLFQKKAFELLCFLIATIYKLYFKLLIRKKIIGKNHWKTLRNKNQPVIHAIWHNDELIQPYMNQHSNVTIMISLSKDGELLATTLKHLGYKSIRGSSSKRGKIALQEMIEALRMGQDVVFATDGPRGPRHKVKMGAIIGASQSKAPIIPSVCNATNKFIFKKSWDKGIFPLPFSKVIVMYGKPFYVPENLSKEDLETYRQKLENEFEQLTENALNYFNFEWRKFSFLANFFIRQKLLRLILLYPLSLLYETMILIRNILFNVKLIPQIQVPSNVISIGNISLGGTGKTPLTQYLCKKFITNGHDKSKLAIAMRDFADEAKMLADLDIPIVTNKKKWKAVQEAYSRHQAKTILVDDGFQHRYFSRETDIVLVNATEALKNNYLLPAGTLREPLTSLKRVTIIVISRSSEIEYESIKMKDDPTPIENLIKTIREYNKKATIVESSFVPYCETELKNKKLLLLSAIAGPESFAKQARALEGIVKKQIIYPDHYIYNDSDYNYFSSIKDNFDIVLTTEKDAAKLDKNKINFHVLKIKFKIENIYGKDTALFN